MVMSRDLLPLLQGFATEAVAALFSDVMVLTSDASHFAEESTVVHEGPRGAAARAGLADSFDDKEGYYTFTVRVKCGWHEFDAVHPCIQAHSCLCCTQQLRRLLCLHCRLEVQSLRLPTIAGGHCNDTSMVRATQW